MSTNYDNIREKTKDIKEKLEIYSVKLDELKPEDKENYPNPQLRLWSGDIRNLEEFAVGLEEWLSEPKVAEAKRYLSDLRRWPKAPTKASLEELEKDWRFLSENLREIEQIHKQLECIEYEGIKKGVCDWILKRIIEKDIEHAIRWATNVNKFATSVKSLEGENVESKLAHKVRRDSVKELLSVSSFDKDNVELVDGCRELIEKSDNLAKNKPSEIEEKAVLNTYRKGSEIELNLSAVSEYLENIRKLMVNLEWVREFADFRNYGVLWVKKQNAWKKDDLASICHVLEAAEKTANDWKDARKREIDSTFAKIRRMSRSIDSTSLVEEVSLIEEKRNDINWNRPSLESLSEVLSKMDSLNSGLRGELIKKLKSEDAISILEEPDIIEDLGEQKGWDFGRFIRALEVVLRNGIIEIKAEERT